MRCYLYFASCVLLTIKREDNISIILVIYLKICYTKVFNISRNNKTIFDIDC